MEYWVRPITPIMSNPPSPPVPILEVQNLSKSYRQAGGETTVAIGNITVPGRRR